MTTSEDRLRAIATRWIEEGWQQGDESVIDELHAPDFVDHDSSGRSADRDGFKAGLRSLYAAFPDFRAEIEDLVVDALQGKVAVRWSATGTHSAPYLGLEPSGRRIGFKGIEIIRISGGKIVQRWGEWDGLDLLAQMD